MRAVFLTLLLLDSAVLAAQTRVTSAKLECTPLVARTADGGRQVLLAEIDSQGLKDAVFRLSGTGWPGAIEIPAGEIAKGRQLVRLYVPVADADGLVHGSLKAAGEQVNLEEIPLTAPRKWIVYLVQHSHTDIGYTRPQTEILPEHLRYIDYALDFCDLTDAYPDDARFRWTCEVSWAVREYLRRRPSSQIERLKKRVEEGRIELTGMFLNMSEIADESALAASLQPLHEIREVLGNNIQSAMQNDVNGAAWCLPDYFSGIGIRYLTMGINKTRSILPFDKPTSFWWESPSGKRVLAFRPDHYMTGNSWQIHEGRRELIEPGLARYLNGLAQARYPFDRVAVQFSGYSTDNSPPALKECDLVEAWNEAYAWPRLRLATAHEFLEYVATNHAEELEVHRQAWPDWWTDGFGSAARETAASRETHAALQVTRGLLTMASLLGARPSTAVAARIASIEEALLFYDEHTFGAAESITHPEARNSMVQWGEKAAYVWDAVKNAGLLREEALGQLQGFVPRGKAPVVAVYNTLGRSRSGPVEVFIDQEILPKDRRFRIVDSDTGEEVPAQILRSRAEGSYWALWTKEVPPLGFKTFRIEAFPETAPKPQPGRKGSTVLENAFYRVEINPQTGAVSSLRDKQAGKEIADTGAPWQLGQFIYERAADRGDFDKPSFPKDHPFRRTSLRDVRLEPPVTGPIWQTLEINAEADGCLSPGGVRVEIRLYQTEKRIDFIFTVRKAPVTDPEAVYVAFPFNAPGGKLVYEGQGGIVAPGETQLPGSSSDWQTIQSFVAARSQAGQIILASNQAPLVQLGEINLGKWQPVTRIDRPHVYSWVMNNYWFTNFRAFQDGEFSWSYSLTSTPSLSNRAAVDFGWNVRIPIVARVLTPGASGILKPFVSTMQINPSNVMLVGARPARDGEGIILHLREVEGRDTTAKITCPLAKMGVRSLAEVNVLEEQVKSALQEVSLSPFETKFVEVRVSEGPKK